MRPGLTEYCPGMWDLVRKTVGIPKVAVELGTRYGDWAHGLLTHVGAEQLFCIDPWRNARGRFVCADVWLANLEKWAFKNVFPLRGRSVEWGIMLRHLKVDLLYVDGDHHHKAALADLETWWPMVRSGGLIMCHDYNEREVNGAVKEFEQKIGVEFGVGGWGPLISRRGLLTAWLIKP